MRPLFEVSLLAVTWIIGWLLLWRVPRLPPARTAFPRQARASEGDSRSDA